MQMLLSVRSGIYCIDGFKSRDINNLITFTATEGISMKVYHINIVIIIVNCINYIRYLLC